MATTTAKESGGGAAAVLLALAAIALALGGSNIHGGGSSSSTSGGSTPGDPCHNQPSSKVIGTWGSAYLRCGGWRHIMDGHPLKVGATPNDVLTCIDNVLASGVEVANKVSAAAKWVWRYRGGLATVIVDTEDGHIRTAHTEGSPGNDWTGCAEG